jgi:hypothetical protein
MITTNTTRRCLIGQVRFGWDGFDLNNGYLRMMQMLELAKIHFWLVLAFAKMGFSDIFGDSTNSKHLPSIFRILTKLEVVKNIRYRGNLGRSTKVDV